MTYTETALVDRINKLTMMVLLQELRAQVLAQQVREANAIIEATTKQFQAIADEMLGAIEVCDGEGDRIA